MSPDALSRRLRGDFPIDPWGLDTDLVTTSAGLSRLRWALDVGGLPVPDGPVAIVFNRRFGLSEPLVVAEGLRRATGRHLRVVGLPDVPAIGPTLRRFGMVLDHPEEVASLLRQGEAVGIPLSLTPRSRTTAGEVHPDTLASVVTARVPVVPTAAVGRESGFRWRIVFGGAVEPRDRDDPLARVDLADQARAGVQDLLDATVPPRLIGG